MYRDIRGVQNLGSTIWGKDFVGNSQHAAKEPNCPVSPGRKESKNIWIHQPVKRSAIKPHLSVYVGFCALVGPEGVMLPCLFPSAMPAKFKVQSTKTYGSSVTINLLAQSITVLASALKETQKKHMIVSITSLPSKTKSSGFTCRFSLWSVLNSSLGSIFLLKKNSFLHTDSCGEHVWMLECNSYFIQWLWEM